MRLVSLMVIAYIAFCIRIATRPCKYFQLNASFFDREAGIFSKADINELIPPQWRLAQFYDDGIRQPARYPVFVKPEWSQNARGVCRAGNAAELRRIREKIKLAGGKYLIQQAAAETGEYEIFSIRHHRDPERFAVLTVTRTCNDSEAAPVNGIYNPNTRYTDITDSFSPAQLGQIRALVRRIGRFTISRACVCANSTDDLLRGNFHVIEVNLFLPMPINMLDTRHSWKALFAMVMKYMKCLALATKYRDQNYDQNCDQNYDQNCDQSRETKPVFIKSMLYNRRGKLPNFLRSHL